ncbi:MAG: hypothetical protein ABSG89_02000 [Bacteroidales bacterium]
MKRLLFLFMILFLFSCQKRNCYQCEIEAKIIFHKVEISSATTTLERCEATEKEIKDYEKANNTVTAINENSFNVGIKILSCKCTKEEKRN